MPHNLARWPAAILALVCFSSVIAAVFRDVRQVSDLGPNHIYILLGMFAALGAVHYAQYMKSWWRVLCWTVAISATITSVGLSAGRNRALLDEKVDASQHSSTGTLKLEERLQELKAKRQELHGKLPQLERSLADAQKEQKTQCSRKSNEDRCDASTLAMDTAKKMLDDTKKDHRTASNDYDKLFSDLITAKPAQRPNAELNSITEVWQLLSRSTLEEAQHSVYTLWPYFLAMLGELGTILFAHIALGHREPPSTVVIPPAPVKANRAPANATVTLAQIAKELGMSQKNARKVVRNKLKMDRPIDGWKFTPADAETLKQRIVLAQANNVTSSAPN